MRPLPLTLTTRSHSYAGKLRKYDISIGNVSRCISGEAADANFARLLMPCWPRYV